MSNNINHVIINNKHNRSNYCLVKDNINEIYTNKNMLDDEIFKHIKETCTEDLNVMVVGNRSKNEMQNHLKIRVPIWISNDLNLNYIDKNFYNLIFRNTIENNSKILDNLNSKTNINYCVIGKMNVIDQQNNNYHAIHAYGLNFESPFTVEYEKYKIKSGLNEDNI